MALQKDLTFNGITQPNVYFKVVRVEIKNYGTSMIADILVNAYLSKDWADVDAPPLTQLTYRMEQFDSSVDTVSAGTQIYQFLKALPDYNNALDV